jgi:hypothetical protein
MYHVESTLPVPVKEASDPSGEQQPGILQQSRDHSDYHSGSENTRKIQVADSAQQLEHGEALGTLPPPSLSFPTILG